MADHCQVPFSKLVQFLEILSEVKKHKQKTQMLLEFFDRSNVQNFFPIIRLMLPAFDMERGQYGLKETTLAKLYVDLLSLPNREKEALIYFKNPQKALPGCPAGSFSEVLQFVIRNRVGDRSSLTVEDINKELDELANSLTKDDKKRVLSRLLQSTNALEQKWLTKIILKDLKMGSNEKILKCFHPKALEIFYNTNSLREVFTRLKDKNADLDLQLFQLHHPIRPMLAGRKVYDELKKVLISLEVLVETKFDGERIQCHMSADGQVNFFTRNANDYTYLYGPKMRDYILQAVIGVHSVILDGEMIVWDEATKRPAPFGQNKPVALADMESDQHLTYMVFDILYLKTTDEEEIDLMKKPLIERKQLLDRCIERIPNRVEKIMGKRVVGTKAVLDEFNKAIEKDEEGIIAKQANSLYIPDDRSSLWLKLKTDYIEGIGDSLDLLVVGGYFGSERRSAAGDDVNHITVFLMAIASKVDLKDPRRSKFVPFCKVGTGYSLDELQQLRDKLRIAFRPYNLNNPPDYWPSWTPGAGERPDMVISDPSKSVILELRGAELVKTEKFPAGLCLRFPKVSKIRYDKNWDQCMTVLEIQGLTQSLIQGDRPVAVMEEGDNAPVERKKRQNTKKTGDVAVMFKDTDTSDIQPQSKLFEGREFYFISLKGFHLSKEEMERLVVQHGGSKVQNFLKSTTDLIASDASILKVRNLINTYPVDIIRPEWVLSCVEQKEIVPLRPKYMLFASARTEAEFERNYSRFGDGYYQDYRNGRELMDVARSVDRDLVTAEVAGWPRDWLDIRAPDGFKQAWDGLKTQALSDFHFYLYGQTSLLEDKLWKGLLEVRIMALGGHIEPELTSSVTHLVRLPNCTSRSWPSDIAVVDTDWVLSMTKA
jgi:DNA ligase-4